MQVAVIGVGVMGSAIAGRLLDVGAAVAVYDVAPDKCRVLTGRGARLAASPRDATAGAEFAITSLNSADVVERAVFGADGVAAAAARRRMEDCHP